MHRKLIACIVGVLSLVLWLPHSVSAVDSVKFKINSQTGANIAPPSGFSLRVFDVTTNQPTLTNTDPAPTNNVYFTTNSFDALLGNVSNYQEGDVYTIEYQPYYLLERLGISAATSSGTWTDSQMYYCLDDIYATFFPVDGQENCTVLENPFDFQLLNRLYNQSGWINCADHNNCSASDGATGSWVNFYGLFNYPTSGATLTLQVKIEGINSAVTANGSTTTAGVTTTFDAITHTLTKSMQFTSPANKQFFSLPFNANELGQGTFGSGGGNVTVTLSDGTDIATVVYTGRTRIGTPDALDLNDNDVTALAARSLTTFAGAIFFPSGTTPHIKNGAGTVTTPGTGAGTNYYCLDTTGCFNFGSAGNYQLWTKDIAGAPYPFFVSFYGLPQSKKDLKILDSTW